MATGFVWLAGFSDDVVVKLVKRQGFADPKSRGPKAPKSIDELMVHVRRARKAGYGLAVDCSAPGISTIAVTVRPSALEPAIAVLNVTGPTSRLPEKALRELAPALTEAANALLKARHASPVLSGTSLPVFSDI